MEGLKLTAALTISLMVLMAFSSFEAMSALEHVGAPAPSPTMENAGVTLSLPTILAVVASLIACFYQL